MKTQRQIVERMKGIKAAINEYQYVDKQDYALILARLDSGLRTLAWVLDNEAD